MPWLRLHTDILADPKLMRASREGAKHLHLTPWLFAFAKQADDGGRLSVGDLAAEPQDIAAMVPCVTVIQVRNCLKELRTIGVLVEDSDGVLRFSRWEPRQSKPSSSPEAIRDRVRKHRQSTDMAQAPKVEGQVDVTPNSTNNRGVSVTPPEEKRGEEKRREESVPLRGGWPAGWTRIFSQHVGEIPPGRVGKAAAPVVKKYGEARATEMWDVYCRQRRHFRFGKFEPEHNDPKATTPEDFAQTAKQWFDLTEPIIHATA